MSRRSRGAESASTTRRRLRPFGWTVVSLCALLLVAAIWVGWTWWGSTMIAGDKARVAVSAARASWSASPAPAGSSSATSGPADGKLIAVMRIPRLGADWAWPVYASTDDATSALDHGLAWYRGSVLPGQTGNFAVAGRSATGADAFRHLDRVRKGDTVVVETPSSVFTYRIDVPPSALTVTSSDDWVLDPVPGYPDASAQRPLITLTTNRDLVPSSARSVGVGHLVSTQHRVS